MGIYAANVALSAAKDTTVSVRFNNKPQWKSQNPNLPNTPARWAMLNMPVVFIPAESASGINLETTKSASDHPNRTSLGRRQQLSSQHWSNVSIVGPIKVGLGQSQTLNSRHKNRVSFKHVSKQAIQPSNTIRKLSITYSHTIDLSRPWTT
ncbi:hypothetical protein ACLOJK_040475 [Asimina triloba]